MALRRPTRAKWSTSGVADGSFTRGFRGRRREGGEGRLPPGQYLVDDFPVLTAGPTPRTPLEEWDLTVAGAGGERRWTWEEFRALPSETFTVDIHCVTRWSKLDTEWEGVSLDVLLEGLLDPATPYLKASCDGGYTTTMPVDDVVGGRAWVAFGYGGAALEPAHGGPARLLVPHLYLWKSAKWVRRLELLHVDEPGFWESLGYHAHGDPWREQRTWGD
jgi:DMSO/TMAO reductase YedYZ molybdopterin-dependent catalytic subunit